MVVRTRRRSRSPRDGVGAHHPGRPACGSPAPGGAPSLSSAVIRGTPWRPARVRTAASPRRRAGDRRRTGNGSPVRLPGEILRRLAQDVPLGLELGVLGLHRRYLCPQLRQLGLRRSGPPRSLSLGRWGIGRRARRIRVQRVHPHLQRVPGDSRVRRDPSQRRTRSRPIQVNSLAAELLRVVLAGHDRGSSRFPGRGRIQRVQDQGSSPGSPRLRCPPRSCHGWGRRSRR